MPAYNFVLVRPGELWLKGKNRNDFVRRLRRNLASSVEALYPEARVFSPYGRFMVELPPDANAQKVAEICAATPGVSSASPVLRLQNDPELIVQTAVALAQEEWAGETAPFAAKVKRVWKGFPIDSPTLSRQIGEGIIRAMNLPVQLVHPVLELGVEIQDSCTYLFARRIRGVGGLPVGSAGRVMLLLSGGIDSPVAGALAQKRGCELDAVYFHSPPLIGEQSLEKVERLAKILSPCQGGLRLHVVYFTAIQHAIHKLCNERFTVLLYRRFMYRIAAELASNRHCLALCTGENLGQVASQTIENLRLVDRLTPMLTLRPLCTYDKLETIEIARKMGSFEISTLPYDDCCTLFMPKNPATRATEEELAAEEAKLEVEALVSEAIEKMEVIVL